jgi:hypothetical protein
MLQIILSFLVAIRVFVRSRSDTALEVLALRQQVAPLGGRPATGEPRHRDRLAPRRVPSLLALAIPATRRTTEDH